MIEKKCICRNVGVCSLANNESIQTIVGDDIVELYCSECGEIAEEYIEVQEQTKPKGGSKKVKVMLGVLLLGAIAISAYFILFGKSKENPIVLPENSKPREMAPPVNESTEINIESLALSKTLLELKVGESEQLTLLVNPQEASTGQLQWLSEDESVATVENGAVKAVAKGKTLITIGRSDKVLAECKVEVRSENRVSESQTNKTDFGTWTGGTKNNKPHGSNITFTFTSEHIIDKRDPKQRVASAGDYIIGEYSDGSLVHGRWYKKSGGLESVIIGRP